MSSHGALAPVIEATCDPGVAATTDEVRRLLEAAVRVNTTDDVLEAVTARLAAAADRLEGHRSEDAGGLIGRDQRRRLDFGTNPVLGPANPFAPPVHVEVVDGEVVGRARFHRAYEGPPDQVHGGVLSLLLDQTLGLANVVAGVPGMTRSLHVRFRRPTPLYADLEVHSFHARVDGRDIVSEGSIRVGDTTTVTAYGVFRSLSRERGQAYFGDRMGRTRSSDDADTRPRHEPA